MIYSGLKLMGRLFMVDCRQRLWLKWFRVESVIVMGGRALSFISLPPPPPLSFSTPHPPVTAHTHAHGVVFSSCLATDLQFVCA